jgi:omega-6 fatty acid desaturase (delta-12 desaturase)
MVIDAAIPTFLPLGAEDVRSSPRRPSLGTVAAEIPAACYERPAWRGLLAVGRDLMLLAALVALLLSTDRVWLLLPAWLLAASTISGLFVLGHDAAHGALFSQRWLNRVIGQLAMLPTLHALSVWSYGHNRIHHAFATCEGMDFVWHPATPAQYARLPRWQRVLHRVEWSACGSGVYYLRSIWWDKIVRSAPPAGQGAAFRRDRTIVAVFALAASAALLAIGWRSGGIGGALWCWVKVLVVPWLLWNWAIGWAVYIQHISPDVQWQPRRRWSKFAGQVDGSTVYILPAWINLFWHNIFVHVPHHVDPRVPYYHLPRAAAALRERWPEPLRERPYRLRDYVRTTRRCKLYDFERGGWLTYRDGAVRNDEAALTADAQSPARSAPPAA